MAMEQNESSKPINDGGTIKSPREQMFTAGLCNSQTAASEEASSPLMTRQNDRLRRDEKLQRQEREAERQAQERQVRSSKAKWFRETQKKPARQEREERDRTGGREAGSGETKTQQTD
ncbi:uncharacterized protein [Macrobrachium rosenbergii]|uniref:uncharacterized protein n=1 Tax=Macrobrachium rosenbergii TaxID=79674 RepID=UPI0034D64923